MDPSISFGIRARELILEALKSLRDQGFNFTRLTTDDEGFIYALNVFYAGPTVNTWRQGLGPHQGTLRPAFFVAGGRRFRDYQVTAMGAEPKLRTFCHENGHMICDLPDLYDDDRDSNGVGSYCLMCNGASPVNPVQVCAYPKAQAGWAAQLTTITPGMSATISAGRNEFHIYRRNDTEYFIIENRQQAGRDEALPDAGLAIWHVDEGIRGNSLQQMTPTEHYGCSLEQADNRFDLERKANRGDVDDLFGALSATAFGGKSEPNSRWWDGTASGLEIGQISASGTIMTFKTRGGGADGGTVGSGGGVHDGQRGGGRERGR